MLPNLKTQISQLSNLVSYKKTILENYYNKNNSL